MNPTFKTSCYYMNYYTYLCMLVVCSRYKVITYFVRIINIIYHNRYLCNCVAYQRVYKSEDNK